MTWGHALVLVPQKDAQLNESEFPPGLIQTGGKFCFHFVVRVAPENSTELSFKLVSVQMGYELPCIAPWPPGQTPGWAQFTPLQKAIRR